MYFSIWAKNHGKLFNGINWYKCLLKASKNISEEIEAHCQKLKKEEFLIERRIAGGFIWGMHSKEINLRTASKRGREFFERGGNRIKAWKKKLMIVLVEIYDPLFKSQLYKEGEEEKWEC